MSNSLSHFGIPGMKWGHRKTPLTRSQKIAQLEAKRDKADPNQIIRGIELRNWGIKKSQNKINRELAAAEKAKGSKLTTPERHAIIHKIGRRKAEASILKWGAVNMSVLAGLGYGVGKIPGLSPRAVRTARVGVVGLMAMAGKIRVNELQALSTFENHEQAVNDINRLKKGE